MLYRHKYPATEQGMLYENNNRENQEKNHNSHNKNENDNDFNIFDEESNDEADYDESPDKFKNLQNQQRVKTTSKPENISQVVPINTGVLTWSQTQKLDFLLNERNSIDGQGNFPALNVPLKDFITNLKYKLIEKNVFVNDVRINGGMASYILTSDTSYAYSDIDIIFSCNLSKDSTEDADKCDVVNECAPEAIIDQKFDLIKYALFECLMDLLPVAIVKDKLMMSHLKDAYIVKMVKIVNSQDCWSLICLRNNDGRNIEFKFVEKMKRQFQFSVDSFQICVENLLKFYESNPVQCQYLSEQCYPSVECESMYGDFYEAFKHLENKLIATKLPEEIRGGGLLKYCHLLIRGYRQAYPMEIEEKYMCSRFFIDYNDIDAQNYTLSTYLRLHFQNELSLKLKYLAKLYEIVNKSTVCLMNHERQQTLNLISSLRQAEELKNYPHNNNNSGYYYLANFPNFYIPFQNYSNGQYNAKANANNYQRDNSNTNRFVEFFHNNQSQYSNDHTTNTTKITHDSEKMVNKKAETLENFESQGFERPKGFDKNAKGSINALNQLDVNARQVNDVNEVPFKASPTIASLSSPMSETNSCNNSSASLNFLSSNSSISSSPSVSPLPYYQVQNGVYPNEIVQNTNYFYLIEHSASPVQALHNGFKSPSENISMFQCKIPNSSRIEIHYNFYNPPPYLYAFINHTPKTYDTN